MCPLLLKTRPKVLVVDNNKRNILMSEETNVNPTYTCEFLMKLFLALEENISVYL